MKSAAVAGAVVMGALLAAVSSALALRGRGEQARCGPGFAVRGPRCVVAGWCPAPLVATIGGCEAPDNRIFIRDATVTMGSSDWEAEGRIPSRSIHVEAFRIDAFEVTRRLWGRFVGSPVEPDDAMRAASGMTRAEAAAFCAWRGGRLPSEKEWIVAAGSAMNPPRRYPWGDTGAVCRRGAWGLAGGPCATSGRGPDTVGAHPDGDSALGMHDLAGNVAEWVAREGDDGDIASPNVGIVKGGSWQSALATDLRIWARLEVDPGARDPRVGLRCAYPP